MYNSKGLLCSSKKKLIKTKLKGDKKHIQVSVTKFIQGKPQLTLVLNELVASIHSN